MDLQSEYSKVQGQHWVAEDYIKAMPEPKAPIFELFRGAPYGLPITDQKRCENWLFYQTARHYGLSPCNVPLEVHYEINQVAECLVMEAKNAHKDNKSMVSPQDIRYMVIDRPLLWYLYLTSTEPHLPFLLCINSFVQDFINLSVNEKALCHERAYLYSTLANVEKRVIPCSTEQAYTFTGEGIVVRTAVRKLTDLSPEEQRNIVHL